MINGVFALNGRKQIGGNNQRLAKTFQNEEKTTADIEFRNVKSFASMKLFVVTIVQIMLLDYF
jgi:hypothetical protein